jgi:hypothetical protein
VYTFGFLILGSLGWWGCSARGPVLTGPPALEAETTATTGRVKAPAPPPPCQALFEVRVGRSWCERASATAEGAAVPNRFATYPGRTRAHDGSQPLIDCALECTPGLDHSRVVVWDRDPFFRGSLLCELGPAGTFWVDIGEHAPLDLSTSVGAQWRTHLDSTGTVQRRTDGESGGSRTLVGDNLCPAGQPTRTAVSP